MHLIDFDDPDRSSMRNPPVLPNTTVPLIPTAGCGTACGSGIPTPASQTPRYSFQTVGKFDSEFRNDLAYHQPAGALASVAYYFCVGSLGTLLGLADFLRGKESIKWDPIKAG